jgi:hypothetical protein
MLRRMSWQAVLLQLLHFPKGLYLQCLQEYECYDLQQGHMTLGQNRLGHVMSV